MTDQEPSQPVTAKPTQASMLKLLIPAMIVLLGIAAFVYSRNTEPPDYVPGPDEVQKVKTAREVADNIEALKAAKDVPAGEKQRILGFLSAELEQAKAREAAQATPAPK